MSSTAVDIECRPRWMTPRTESRQTRGPEVKRVARMLGFDLHPWQEEALDVAYEVDDSGRLVYGSVVAILPRRSGKTVLGFSGLVHRAHAFVDDDGEQRSLSTMQSAIDSRDMFRDTWVPMLDRSEFSGTFEPVYQISHEKIRWENGSVHSVRAPGPKAGVGSDLDHALFDEVWALRDDSMEGAVLPTMATRPDPQAWFLSMAGTLESEFLIQKRDIGRELVDAGVTRGTFYLEFSAPEDADPSDEKVWWGCHPALGRTVSIERLRSFHQAMELDEFAQHFLGVWRNATQRPLPIPLEEWNTRVELNPRRARVARPCLVVDVNPERTSATICAAGAREDGRAQVEVIRHDEGTGWVADDLVAILKKVDVDRVGVDPGGPAGFLLPELEKALKPLRRELHLFKRGESAHAAGAFLRAFTEGDALHLGQPELDAALLIADKRKRGELWIWQRAGFGDICPLVGCSLALWLAAQTNKQTAFDWSLV